MTRKIAEHAFEVKMSVTEMKQFCKCVNKIIAAYERKIQEVKGLKDVIRQMKKKSQEKSRKIKQLEQINDQLRARLASAVCEECGAKGVREKFTNLSMQV